MPLDLIIRNLHLYINPPCLQEYTVVRYVPAKRRPSNCASLLYRAAPDQQAFMIACPDIWNAGGPSTAGIGDDKNRIFVSYYRRRATTIVCIIISNMLCYYICLYASSSQRWAAGIPGKSNSWNSIRNSRNPTGTWESRNASFIPRNPKCCW